MKEVCVITGGGSGMGLATAKYIKDRLVIISGRTESKLAAACVQQSQRRRAREVRVRAGHHQAGHQLRRHVSGNDER